MLNSPLHVFSTDSASYFLHGLQFMSTEAARSRYWARSFAGWREFSAVQPNAAHEGLTRLQSAGWVGAGPTVECCITPVAEQHLVTYCLHCVLGFQLNTSMEVMHRLSLAGGQRDHTERGPAASRRRHPGCRGAARHHPQVHQRAGARLKMLKTV